MITHVLDMDGTIFDLYGIEGWEPMLRAENPLPYRIAPPLVNPRDLQELILVLKARGDKFEICSHLSKESTRAYDHRVRYAKLMSLKETNLLPLMDAVHFVKYGRPKFDFVRHNDGLVVLYDDDLRVCNRFVESGGAALWVKPGTLVDVLTWAL